MISTPSKITALGKSLIKDEISCQVLVKHEYIGATGSSKDEVAKLMIAEAQENNEINPDTILISYSSGNLSISLAHAAIQKKYKTVSIVPFRTSKNKLDALRALGSKIILGPPDTSSEFNGCHYSTELISLAQNVHKETPNSYLFHPYEDSPAIQKHYEKVAHEIIPQCDGRLDILVCGVETAGMITGLAKTIKKTFTSCKVIGVKAVKTNGEISSVENSKPISLLSDPNRSENNIKLMAESEVEDLGCPYNDLHPPIIELGLVDDWITVEDKDSFCAWRELIELEGLLTGTSGGTLVRGAIEAAKKLNIHQDTDAKVLVVLQEGLDQSPTDCLDDKCMLEKNYWQREYFNKKHWWAYVFIGNLKMKAPVIISDELEMESVFEKVAKNGNCIVMDKNDQILGIVSKELIIAMEFAEKDFHGTEDIRKKRLCDVPGSICTDFLIVNHANKTLADVSLLLNESTFLIVTASTIVFKPTEKYTKEEEDLEKYTEETVVGIVTNIDLLNYISKVEGHHREKSNWDVKNRSVFETKE